MDIELLRRQRQEFAEKEHGKIDPETDPRSFVKDAIDHLADGLNSTWYAGLKGELGPDPLKAIDATIRLAITMLDLTREVSGKVALHTSATDAKPFHFGSATFWIRPMDPLEIRRVDSRVKKAEMSGEDALREFFKHSLIDFQSIEGCEEFSREQKLDCLFEDPEVRNFVLKQAFDLLQREGDEIERRCNALEQRLLKAGNLKS